MIEMKKRGKQILTARSKRNRLTGDCLRIKETATRQFTSDSLLKPNFEARKKMLAEIIKSRRSVAGKVLSRLSAAFMLFVFAGSLNSASADCIENQAFAERSAKTAAAIDKFKAMGVGVSQFELMLKESQKLNAEGKNQEAQNLLDRLHLALIDQQKRFYASKMDAWQKQVVKARSLKTGRTRNNQVQSGKSSIAGAGAGLSKGAHTVLSGRKGDYSPLIYPIAR